MRYARNTKYSSKTLARGESPVSDKVRSWAWLTLSAALLLVTMFVQQAGALEKSGVSQTGGWDWLHPFTSSQASPSPEAHKGSTVRHAKPAAPASHQILLGVLAVGLVLAVRRGLQPEQLANERKPENDWNCAA